MNDFFIIYMRPLVRYPVEHEKIKFISTRGHVLFCLSCKHTENDVFDDFPKIFQKCSEGQKNVSGHFLKIAEDF